MTRPLLPTALLTAMVMGGCGEPQATPFKPPSILADLYGVCADIPLTFMGEYQALPGPMSHLTFSDGTRQVQVWGIPDWLKESHNEIERPLYGCNCAGPEYRNNDAKPDGIVFNGRYVPMTSKTTGECSVQPQGEGDE